MKKILFVALSVFILTGCGNMNNTPTKKVEALLSKYQSNDSEVMNDLDNVLLTDSNFTDDERSDYKEFMKKHYQDMTYKVKNESIDGDSATVEVEVTVRNYSNAVNEANDYRLNNSSEFDEDNTFAKYRLGKLKDVTDTETYTIVFSLTKNNDEWQVNPLSSDDESKLNGLYGVADITMPESSSTTDRDTATDSTDTETDNNNQNTTSDNMPNNSDNGNE
ncbi:MAG: membrane lipoprotein lipid attachment site-containing protein [Bacilli bacterium]|nr:membrane lipoprotein lipid attachment site-containing protein [Bacilli bacterium]